MFNLVRIKTQRLKTLKDSKLFVFELNNKVAQGQLGLFANSVS